jgi:hypothetical protein
MKRLNAIVCSGCAALLLAGCGTGSIDSTDDEEGRSGETAEAIANSNAMNPNAMNPNAMNPNALNPNALNPNALNPSAMSASAMSALHDPGDAGTLSRQLLKYTVSCALSPSQSFSLTWTDAQGAVHNDVYVGLLGLEPTWATTPLSAAGEGWVSSCLASRVNWYGVPVILSSRGATDALATTADERANYAKIEGAFFGNLFTATPAVYTCYNTGNIANSRSWQRDCASGHVNADGSVSSCGILQILGSCENFCSSVHASKQYYPSCFLTSGRMGTPIGTVVTTALP